MPDQSSSELLVARSLSKRFGAVRALQDVHFDLRKGEVHAVIGENGAGKSTLMKIMAGIVQPDLGMLELRGQPIHLRGPVDAQRLGIAMIHQELNLIDDLSIADNIFLGRESTRLGLVNGSEARRAAADLLGQLGSSLSPARMVRSLSIAQKQIVEIARAVSLRASVLIMDEPTAVLSGREIPALFQLIGQLKSAGVGIVYISHLLEEVLELADRITIMRDGETLETLDRAAAREIGEARLAGKMVGRALSDHFPPRLVPTSQTVLEVRNLSVPKLVSDVSFELHRGEILGMAGLIGAGRTELAEAIVGLRKKSAGVVLMNGKPIQIRNMREAVKVGIAYLSEDRKATGLALNLSVGDNVTVVSLKRYCHPFLNRRQQNQAARRHVLDLRIKVPGVGTAVQFLSGGNQQKVALAKWLEIHPTVLIVDEPTRGVDIGVKEQIYRLIQSLAAAGMACVLISSELNEVIGLSHRIAVMRGGRLVATLGEPQMPGVDQIIMQYAAGATPPTPRAAG